MGRRADLVATRGGEVLAVELKLRDWREALRQAVAYQLGADRTWIAMPLAAASRACRHRYRFEREGVGLFALDDRGGVRAPIAAGSSPRLLPFVRDGVLAYTERPLLVLPDLGPRDPDPGEVVFRASEIPPPSTKDFTRPRP